MDAGEHARAGSLLKALLLRRAERSRPEDLRPLHLRLAEIAKRLGDPAQARRWLAVAHQVDPFDRDVVRGLGDLHFDLAEWAEAAAHYQTLQVQYGDGLAAAERVDLYHRMGRIKMAGRDRVKARNLWEKALHLDPTHRPTLDALAEMWALEGDFERVVECLERAVAIAQGRDRFELLRRMGDVRRDRIGDADGAIRNYRDALDIVPDDRDALTSLLDLHRGTGRWKEAVEIAGRLAEVETDPSSVAARRRFAAATYRDVFGDAAAAVEHYELALDADSADEESAAEIERILSSSGDWGALERSWVRMLGRPGAAGATTGCEKLLQRLAELARDRLGALDRAEAYYRQAVDLNPSNRALTVVLADLYERMPGRWADAAALHGDLIRGDPKRVESFRALRRIYRSAGRADEAWCACAALAALGRAEPAEAEFHERYRPKAGQGSAAAVTPESWRLRLRHPAEDPAVSAVLAAIEPAVLKAFARSEKALGLLRRDRHDPVGSGLAIARAMRQAGAVLGLPPPDLYALPDHPGGLGFAPTEPPAMIAGVEVLSGMPPAELRFVAGRHLALWRPECRVWHILAAVAAETGRSPLRWIAAYLRAALRPTASPGGAADDETLAAARTLDSNLGAAARRALAAAAEPLASAPPPDLAAWSAAIEATADRAGLFVCGDIGAAVAAASRSAGAAGTSSHLRMDEMLVFWVSGDHFHLRREVGTALSSA